MTRQELERALEERCVRKIEQAGGLALKLKIDGVRGFPDRTILMPGSRAWCAEFKRMKTGHVSAQQEEWARKLALVNVAVHFVDTDEQFDLVLRNALT